jgi:hypothetical protein
VNDTWDPTSALAGVDPVETRLATAPVVAMAAMFDDSDPALAMRVCKPALVPSVHATTDASPCSFVIADGPVADPLPSAGAKLTATPGSGSPTAFLTTTVGGVATAAPTVAD